jgi:hypothetical protein
MVEGGTDPLFLIILTPIALGNCLAGSVIVHAIETSSVLLCLRASIPSY